MNSKDRMSYEWHRDSAKDMLSLADGAADWAGGMTPQQTEAVRRYHAHAQVEALLAIAAALDSGRE